MVPPDIPPSVPTQKSFRDHVTSHKISLLILIKEFCVVKNKSRFVKSHQSSDENSWIHTNQQNRDFFITMLKLIQNPDMDLKRLINIIHPIMHSRTYQLFVDRLQELRRNGVAGILDYIASIDSLLVEPAPIVSVVQKSSVLGLFIRRMLLAFDKLSFSHVTKLCHKYYVYYDAAFGSLDDSAEIQIINDSQLDDTLDESECEESQVLATQKQAEYFIAQQAALLQINEGAALSPYQLQQKIKELLKGNPELSEAHYLSFLNTMRVKEYSGARENLYHHFDRNTTVPQDCKSANASEDLSRSSRYAALNLAILHSLFGHREEALAALNEAIMLAQEVNDNICLQYALAWLYRLVSHNKEILIERSIAKSSELGLWCLSSLGIQALTKLKCFSTAQPSSIFDLLIKSDIQNCQHSMTDMLGSAFTLRSGLWTYYGHSMMSNLAGQMLLYLNTSDPVRGGVYHIGEGTCLALRNLIFLYALQGDYTRVSMVTNLSKEIFPVHSEHSYIWKLCDLYIKFDRALYTEKWLKAEQAIEGINVFDERESDYRRAKLRIRQGHLSIADEIIKKLLTDCENSQTAPDFYVKVLLLKANLLTKTANYCTALPSLMTCMAMCKSHHLMHLEAITAIQIAKVQLLLGLPEQALHLLENIFISLLTHSSNYDKGTCCHLIAVCSAEIISYNQTATAEESKKALLKAINMSQKSLRHLVLVKAVNKMKSSLTWLAHMYDKLGMITERNCAAHRFRYLEDELS